MELAVRKIFPISPTVQREKEIMSALIALVCPDATLLATLLQ